MATQLSSNYVMQGASAEHVAARKKLLAAERELIDHVERVAEMRRALPPGPLIEDYEFIDLDGKRVKLSELFSEGKPYLVMYHMMYWQDDQEFCPMCSMWVDAWDGIAHHIAQRTNIVAATLAPLEKAQEWKKHRGWQRIRLLADADASFARDTTAEDSDGDPVSTVLVFEKTPEGIRHLYTMHPEFEDDAHRGIDLLNPSWHIFDLLPSGRGDFNASNDYVR